MMLNLARKASRIEGADSRKLDRISGHDLSDLHGTLQVHPSETALVDMQSAQIGAFPRSPRDTLASLAEVPLIAAEASAIILPSRHRFNGSRAGQFAGSALLHGCLIAGVLLAFADVASFSDDEAGDAVQVVILGDGEVDQKASGEAQAAPQPETLIAEAVGSDTADAQPTEPAPVEHSPSQALEAEPPQALEAEPVSPVEPPQPLVSQALPSEEPEILTSQVPAESSVAQPMPPNQDALVQPMLSQEAQSKPVEPSLHEEAPSAVARKDRPSEPAKEKEKPRPPPKAVPKQTAKAMAKEVGRGGAAKEDSTKGSADGAETGSSNRRSTGKAGGNGEGSAAVGQYPGKVRARINRSVRIPSQFKRADGVLNVQVTLTVSRNGDLAKASIARSSGLPELDAAVLAGVRRAAPFPELPAEWEKPVWTFTQEVQVTGR